LSWEGQTISHGYIHDSDLPIRDQCELVGLSHSLTDINNDGRRGAARALSHRSGYPLGVP
jgi:hypothetical protein